jgi:hypothetical protein
VNIEVIVRYLKQTKDKLTLGWFCSMFRKNDSHYQDELFSHYQSMRPSVAKLLNKTWAPVFYEHVFCKINEDLFAPMYCLEDGVWLCLLVKQRGRSDGVLVMPDGRDFPKYAAYYHGEEDEL